MSERVIPAFQNESEEARWWFDHRAKITDDLIAASANGVSGEGSVARRARKLREAAAVSGQDKAKEERATTGSQA